MRKKTTTAHENGALETVFEVNRESIIFAFIFLKLICGLALPKRKSGRKGTQPQTMGGVTVEPSGPPQLPASDDADRQ